MCRVGRISRPAGLMRRIGKPGRLPRRRIILTCSPCSLADMIYWGHSLHVTHVLSWLPYGCKLPHTYINFLVSIPGRAISAVLSLLSRPWSASTAREFPVKPW